MRKVLKGASLLGCFLFVGVFLTGFLNVTLGINTKIITIDPKSSLTGHRVRVNSLNLGTGTEYYEISAKRFENLDIVNGLLVGQGTFNGGSLVVIGGGKGNVVSGTYVGVVGGLSNSISNLNIENSVIGGGRSNNIYAKDSVIGGGFSNKVEKEDPEGGAILGGKSNRARQGGVVFGGDSNKANGKNSMILGQSVNARSSEFSWSDGQATNPFNESVAQIMASSGILIGTYNGLTGVNLVVNGAVKIAGSSGSGGTAGEIKMLNGCFYSYDGNYWHVFGRNSAAGDCHDIEVGKICKFGKVELQEGDVVTAYSKPYATDCNSNSVRNTNVKCTQGELIASGWSKSYIYPSCYKISGKPIL